VALSAATLICALAANNAASPADAGGLLPKCDFQANLPNIGVFHVMSAHLTKGAASVSNGFVNPNDVASVWRFEYEYTNRLSAPMTFNVGDIGDYAVGANGARYGGVREGPFNGDQRPYPPGAIKTGHVSFILARGMGVPADGMMSGHLNLSLKVVNSALTPFRDRAFGGAANATTVELNFSEVPADCADAPTPRRLGGTDLALPANLIVPKQSSGSYAVRLDADPASVKFASQAGFIWAFQQGVYPDYEQALNWYLEARRRQDLLHDYSYQADIERMTAALQITSVIDLLQRGQLFSSRGDWEYARFYFGRAAALGDVQGMAALGWVHGERFGDPVGEVYWCRKAFAGARQSRRDFEIDAVNHFCPLETFSGMMTRAERKANEISIQRAAKTAGDIQRSAEALTRVVNFLTDQRPRSGGQEIDPVTFARHRNGDYRQASGLPRSGPDSD
jgi:hypothetical protein